MWPNFEQPITKDVIVKNTENKISLSCTTKGASIAYKILDKPNLNLDLNSKWELYTKPLNNEKGKYIYTIAERIGYKSSKITFEKLN